MLGAQDVLLPPVDAGGMGPELEVVPVYPSIHDVLGCLIIIGHAKVSSAVQDAW